MVLPKVVSLHDTRAPLEARELPVPEPGPGEVLIAVSSCGVCHTELDEIEGRTAPPHFPVVPGHEIVGRVAASGPGTSRHQEGDRVGVGWIHHSTGEKMENLAPEFHATGRDVNGGYAEYMTVPEAYAFPIPDVFDNCEAAPLLCAGAIGYRSICLANIQNGDPVGLTGFGGSAHLVLPTLRHLYPDSSVYVFARDESARQFALELGADWAGATEDRAPQPLKAIIDTTPAWKPIVEALRNLAPAGRLVINAIRKEAGDRAALLDINYHDDLWMEREIKSVANIAGRDIAEFLPIASDIPLKPEVEVFPLEQANKALYDLKFKPVRGAKVLQIRP